jgi:integrase
MYYEICLNQKDKFKFIPYARKEQKLPIVLSVQEIQQMFAVCENIKHKVILALLYSCGLRVSELINLKWAHRSRMIINVIALLKKILIFVPQFNQMKNKKSHHYHIAFSASRTIGLPL